MKDFRKNPVHKIIVEGRFVNYRGARLETPKPVFDQRPGNILCEAAFGAGYRFGQFYKIGKKP